MKVRPDTRFRRLKEKGSRDPRLAHAIIDAARIGHVGFAAGDQPYVLPMALAREGDRLLLHGSIASRLMKRLAEGFPCCVTITHFDGLVLARSAFNSSMHYRSVMLFGTARPVTDPEQKAHGLDVLTEHLLPGRRSELRRPTRQELNATLLLELPIETFTVKVSAAPPDDPERDLGQSVWAGVIPLQLVAGKPIPAPDLATGIEPPPYLSAYRFS